ncbi:biotin synthase BioB [Enhygromyxa salina]|uniref:Biotin synthase n=1 Tax=Enhygromyxa salina TaxID=215803 RepID=A0A2S9YRF6_9BACT|nr:biotin synthase BioB [Enhygromyxa salina]PRQ07666.1 Biotin synthase [Enhygromyxa salina]
MTEPRSPAAVADQILAGNSAALDQATLTAWLGEDVEVWELMAAADRVRRDRFGNEVHLCSIVNAKQGGCTEDCGFCSQSKHFETHITPQKFLTNAQMVAASEKALSQRATALGLVTATRGMDDGDKTLDYMVEAVRAVRDAGHTEAHASLGFVDEPGLRRLQAAGLTELNHNLETGRSYFEKIVTTHTYDERIETIRTAKRLGLRTCCGGIFGMGEAPEDRAELAITLRELDVDEVPLNFLVSIDGTALAKVEPLEPMQMLRIIACFRLALPRQNIFIAAGRMHLGQLLPMMFSAGASGMMVGDFLTTPNRSVEDDLQMIEDLGLKTQVCGQPRPELQPMPAPRRLPVLAV